MLNNVAQMTTSTTVIVPCGPTNKIFRRDESGQIVYDCEGYLGGGGYPYVTLERDVRASEHDINELLEHLLPRMKG